MIDTHPLKEVIEKAISGEWGEEGGSVKVLRTTNFTNEGRIDYSKVVTRDIDDEKVKSKKLLKGDIIIEKSGGSPTQPVGRVVYFDSDEIFLCNNFTAVLRPKAKLIFPKYLHYILFTNHKFGFTSAFQNKTTGIINLQLTKYIEGVQIPLPPLPIQQKIAAILDAADELRQKDKDLLKKYDELTQALFLEMFGDPVANPKGWPIGSVSTACEKICGGGTPSTSNHKYYEGTIPWVTPKDMKSEYIFDSIDHVNMDAIESSSAKLIPAGNVLMVIRSGILKHSLPVAINKNEVTINQDMKAFFPNPKVTNSTFLKSFFQAVAPYLLNKVRAVTADNIEFRQIKELNFPMVPLKLQDKFADQIKIIEQQKTIAQESSQKSEELFNSLLQKAFNGELIKENTKTTTSLAY